MLSALRPGPIGRPRGWSTPRRAQEVRLEGLLSLALGIVVLARWGSAGRLVLVTAWATLVGALRILAAIRPRREIQGERMLALSGEALIAFAVLLALFPGAGVLARVKMLGIFALLVGILLFVLVVEQRRQLKLFSWQAHLRAVRARSNARRRLKQQAILTDIRLIGLGFDDETTASAV